MAIYILYLTRELGLPPVALGAIFGLGGGAGVLLGSASASRRWPAGIGLGRTLVGAHFLFGIFGLLLALAQVWPALAAPLVFGAQFAHLAVNPSTGSTGIAWSRR